MPQLGFGESIADELASASPSLMTYNRALAEGGDVVEEILIAHDRRIHLYVPSSASLAFSPIQ